jgi:hypothetical protein
VVITLFVLECNCHFLHQSFSSIQSFNTLYLLKIFAFVNNISYFYILLMPIGTPIIMKHKYILFNKVEQINQRIADYFKWIEGEYHKENLPFKPTAKSPPEMREQKVWDRQPQPATLSGLALHLGFDSLQAFEAYEKNGRFASIAKRARLKIESEYEKMLHQQPSTGAIFALKSLGWMEKQAAKADDAKPVDSTLKIEILPTGPAPASCEQDVKL